MNRKQRRALGIEKIVLVETFCNPSLMGVNGELGSLRSLSELNLHVEGNQIKDEQGRIVVLRGCT